MTDFNDDFLGIDDPMLTAYALGELDGDAAARVERALAADLALRAAVGDIRRAADLVSHELAEEPMAGLRPEQRAAFLNGEALRTPSSSEGESAGVGGAADQSGVLIAEAGARPTPPPPPLQGGGERDRAGQPLVFARRSRQWWAGIGIAAAACLTIALAWPSGNTAREDLFAIGGQGDRLLSPRVTPPTGESGTRLREDANTRSTAAPGRDTQDGENALGMHRNAPLEDKKDASAAAPAGGGTPAATPTTTSPTRSIDAGTAPPVGVMTWGQQTIPGGQPAEPFTIHLENEPSQVLRVESMLTDRLAASPGEQESDGRGAPGFKTERQFAGGGIAPDAQAGAGLGGAVHSAGEVARREVSLGRPVQLGDTPLVGDLVTGLRNPGDDGTLHYRFGIPSKTAAPGTEDYNPITDNPFLRPTEAPLSTFSIDVDTASYSNIRRFLASNQLPPRDACRIEEMINYFRYAYAPPAVAGEAHEAPFSTHIEINAAPWNPQHRLVRIGLKGREIPESQRPPTNLVFLVDVSGSMNSPDKLPLVKESLRLLIDRLHGDDRIAIAVYAGASGLVLDSTYCHGWERQRILDAINQLTPGGSTNGAAGIQLAYDVAARHFIDGGVNRVILCTDGDFNVGVSSEAELVRLIEQKRQSRVFLSVMGYGTGNLKDGKMEQLANHGNGVFGYIDSVDEARKVFVEQMLGTLITIAKDVKIQIEFNPARVAAYRLIGYENRVLAAQDFNDDRKDAGEIGAGHTVTALYEVIPPGVETNIHMPGVDALKYQKPAEPAAAPVEAAASGVAIVPSDELLTLKLRYKEPQGDVSKLITVPVKDPMLGPDASSSDYRFVAAVAAFGMILRDSPYRGNASFDLVRRLAVSSGLSGGSNETMRRMVQDFAHWTLIGRPDLALPLAHALLEADAASLATAVAEQDHQARSRFFEALVRAGTMPELQAAAADLSRRLHADDRDAAAHLSVEELRSRREFLLLVGQAQNLRGGFDVPVPHTD